MRKIIAGIVATVYSLMLAAAPVVAPDVTASVTIATVCGLLVSPLGITFDGNGPGGSVTDGGNSGEDGDDETVTLTNDGNADTSILTIEGTGWTGANPPNAMDVGQTSYDTDGLSPFTGTALSSSSTPIYGGILADNDSNDILFRVDIISDQPADTYSQTITFTFDC